MKAKKRIFMVIILLIFSLQLYSQTWSVTKRLTWTSEISTRPRIAAGSGGNLFLVWRDNLPGNAEIYFKRSTDGGVSWSAPKRLTWSSSLSHHPAVAADPSGRIHVVWHDDNSGNNEIYYKRSTDGGNTWSSINRLTWNSGESENARITADSGSGIHVIWKDDTPGNSEIYYKRSTDSGLSWTAPKRLTWNPENSRYPSIAADSGSGIYIVWDDDSKGNYEIYFKKSIDWGSSWSAVKRLTWNSGGSYIPDIDISSGGGIHVTWFDNTPTNTEIFYKRSTDGGSNWSALTRLTWDTSSSDSPSIAADSGSGIHIVWSDYNFGNWEVNHKLSTDSGSTWGGKNRLTWNSGNSSSPTIDGDSSGGIHVVWNDNTPGNSEIYYKNRK